MTYHTKLLRAYLLGLITGIFAAVAYLAGLLWRKRREEQRESAAFSQKFWQDWSALGAKLPEEETTDA